MDPSEPAGRHFPDTAKKSKELGIDAAVKPGAGLKLDLRDFHRGPGRGQGRRGEGRRHHQGEAAAGQRTRAVVLHHGYLSNEAALNAIADAGGLAPE